MLLQPQDMPNYSCVVLSMTYPAGVVISSNQKNLLQEIQLHNNSSLGMLDWPETTRLILQPEATHSDLVLDETIMIGKVPAKAKVCI